MCELFRKCMCDPNQKRNTTGYQTFYTGTFLLYYREPLKKISKH